MRNFEKIILTAVSLIVIMKIFRLPFSGPLVILSLQILGFIYLFGGWKIFAENEKSPENKFVSTISGFAFFIALTGIMFKLQLWPFAQGYTGMGSFITLGLLTPFAIYKLKKSNSVNENYYKNILKRTLCIGGFCFLLFLIPMKTLVTVYHPNDAEYVRLFMQAEENPGNEEFREDFNNYRDKTR